MRYRVEVSDEAEKQLSKFPLKVRDSIGHAIDELEEKDDSQWSNIKALRTSFVTSIHLGLVTSQKFTNCSPNSRG